jgi:hypothetical protein
MTEAISRAGEFRLVIGIGHERKASSRCSRGRNVRLLEFIFIDFIEFLE